MPQKAGGCFPDDPEDDGPRTTERKEDRCCDNNEEGPRIEGEANAAEDDVCREPTEHCRKCIF